MIDYKAVGERVRALRKKQGLSIENLASITHSDIQLITALENGDNVWSTSESLNFTTDLVFALNTSLDYLFMGIEGAPTLYERIIKKQAAKMN